MYTIVQESSISETLFQISMSGGWGGRLFGGGGLLEGALIRGAVIREGRSVQNVSKGARLIEGRRLFEGGA